MNVRALPMFGAGPVPIHGINAVLEAHHYLGPTSRGWAWLDEFGVLALAAPTSRKLPSDKTWLELTRWCLLGGKNAGSQQFAAVKVHLRRCHPRVTTLISYSDPAVGHTGALYRAYGWLWAPTWMRLRPPPSQGGSWDGDTVESVKDRWVYPLRPDKRRAAVLAVDDDAVNARWPFAQYVEPRWRGKRFSGGGGDYHQWIEALV